jgi:hypothetical protein
MNEKRFRKISRKVIIQYAGLLESLKQERMAQKMREGVVHG